MAGGLSPAHPWVHGDDRQDDAQDEREGDERDVERAVGAGGREEVVQQARNCDAPCASKCVERHCSQHACVPRQLSSLIIVLGRCVGLGPRQRLLLLWGRPALARHAARAAHLPRTLCQAGVPTCVRAQRDAQQRLEVEGVLLARLHPGVVPVLGHILHRANTQTALTMLGWPVYGARRGNSSAAAGDWTRRPLGAAGVKRPSRVSGCLGRKTEISGKRASLQGWAKRACGWHLGRPGERRPKHEWSFGQLGWAGHFKSAHPRKWAMSTAG